MAPFCSSKIQVQIRNSFQEWQLPFTWWSRPPGPGIHIQPLRCWRNASRLIYDENVETFTNGPQHLTHSFYILIKRCMKNNDIRLRSEDSVCTHQFKATCTNDNIMKHLVWICYPFLTHILWNTFNADLINSINDVMLLVSLNFIFGFF